MMQVSISALGALKKYVPEETLVRLDDPSQNLMQLISGKFGVPDNLSRITFVVNGSIQDQDYVPADGDKIVFMVVGGAG